MSHPRRNTKSQIKTKKTCHMWQCQVQIVPERCIKLPEKIAR